MSKQIFLIISDLHFSYKNLTGRKDYQTEIIDIFNNIVELGRKYKADGCEVNLIFLGDIIHNSYKNLIEGVLVNNLFVILKNEFNLCYSVIGNHELSYYRDNPFWTMVRDMNSKKITTVINRSWQPVGLLELLNIEDELIVGDTVFHFNHNRTAIGKPIPNKVNIGLFHQDIVSQDIVKAMTVNKNLEIFESPEFNYFDSSSILRGYNYCFFGHMHKVYGTWNYVDDRTGEAMKLYYLGSLGRTNQTEVQDNFLERNIPAVVITDGSFSTIESNYITLRSREESVIEEIVKANQEAYQEQKEIKRTVNNLTETDNPVLNIMNALGEDQELREIFTRHLDGSIHQFDVELANKINEVI